MLLAQYAPSSSILTLEVSGIEVVGFISAKMMNLSYFMVEDGPFPKNIETVGSAMDTVFTTLKE